MTADKKVASKWPHLRYSRAAASALGTTLPGELGSGEVPLRRPRRCRPCKLICGLFVSLLLAIFLLGSILLNFTNFFENMIHSGLAYQEGGPLFDGWKNPALKPLVRVFVYNYTNADEYMSGRDSKLRVNEVGPYAYRETLQRINVRFNDNGTMSYSERRTHVFEPSLSGGSEQDVLVVPNLPLLGAMSRLVDASFVTQTLANGGLMMVNPAVFEPIPARDFLFGYNNSVYSWAKGLNALAGQAPLPKLGLLATRAGASNDTYTVWTGHGDVMSLDVVSRFNGRASLSAWEGDTCNRIDGSEGAFFNIDAVRSRRPVYLFNAGICRRLTLEFKRESVVMDNIPALEYGPPDDFFHNAVDNADNACYRHSSFDSHLPSGVFNNSPCSYGSPTFLSFPHFYLGDPSLRDVVDGITPPDPEKHRMTFNIHPVLGMNLGALSRVQINTMIRKPFFISTVSRFDDGMIIPVAWIETNAKEFPQEIKTQVYHATFTLRTVEKGMMYAFPILTVIFALILACMLIPCGSKRPKEPPIQVLRLS